MMTALSLIPGTFNPLHEGHMAIYNYCVAKNESTIFLISVYPFDKDAISFTDRRSIFTQKQLFHIGVESRSILGQTREIAGLYASNYGAIIPAMTINVGMDTLSRINDLKYYDSEDEFHYMCDEFANANIKIRAFPRNGLRHIKLRPSLLLHTEFVSSFEEINMSSTEIRNGVPPCG
jgi:hypothetical protein